MIVEGPAYVLDCVDAKWFEILICVSNDDVFNATNGLEDLCLKLCDVQLPFPRGKLSPDCTFEVANTMRDMVRYLSWHPLADDGVVHAWLDHFVAYLTLF